ncbi:hypothetical protein SELMODRAFT_425880 [Selaginella moellendorffii]|uniref:Alanine--tRNA ligase n=1 Tax=Selaginella moellendorffii TaxID=88036 RepID=D8SUL4_SELML|nr:hypothetical protein SELMODRAFT_425880 [Selaginella moellendorffii]
MSFFEMPGNFSFRDFKHDAAWELDFKTVKQKNTDTGLGLERMAKILQKISSILSSNVLLSWLENYTAADGTKAYLKVIGDHLRAGVTRYLREIIVEITRRECCPS